MWMVRKNPISCGYIRAAVYMLIKLVLVRLMLWPIMWVCWTAAHGGCAYMLLKLVLVRPSRNVSSTLGPLLLLPRCSCFRCHCRRCFGCLHACLQPHKCLLCRCPPSWSAAASRGGWRAPPLARLCSWPPCPCRQVGRDGLLEAGQAGHVGTCKSWSWRLLSQPLRQMRPLPARQLCGTAVCNCSLPHPPSMLVPQPRLR